ncbi:MAG TPA: nuclear transport factor 2 family protein [Longimicrobium sp.]|nr:nuclear transport factor 2 family protein [Longimicrobium sp.]
MKRLLTALLLLLATTACAGGMQGGGGGPTTAAGSAAARVVDAYAAAYNRHDLDEFLGLFAPNARIYLHPNEVVTSGTQQLRARYRDQWRENPRLRLQKQGRMVQGNFVIDSEHSVGWADNQDVRVVAIYEVRNGRIQNVWYIR